MTALKIEKHYEQTFPDSKFLFTYEGIGTTSKQIIRVSVYLTPLGSGIQFILPGSEVGKAIRIPALANNVVNTLRNVTIGQGSIRLCLVEHFLAAAAFCNTFDIDVVVEGPELPLGDGSALMWLELFSQAGYKPVVPKQKFELTDTIIISKGDKQLIALPAADFSMTYLMDWIHPCIGKRWCTWTIKQSPTEIASARTFGSQKEHDLLGIEGEAVSLTETGFSKPLHFVDEPVRHKLLDLLGDLVLTGVNPLAIEAQFISIKGGHEIDVDLSNQLKNKLKVKDKEKF